MKAIATFAKQLLLTTLLLYFIVPAIAQKKAAVPANTQRKDFYQLLKEANLTFTFPPGFREINAVNNEDYSFDYALEAPGKNFEIWLEVRSEKQNWISYEHTRHDKNTELENPDSLYIEMGKATAKTLTGDDSFLEHNIPADLLARYNADAGKSYLLNLPDLALTKHYKYALIVSLQKDHTGTLIAIYFTNYKDPDFYKNVNKANHCFKFKPQLPG